MMTHCSTCKHSSIRQYGKVLIGYCKLNLENQYVKNWRTKCVFYEKKQNL